MAFNIAVAGKGGTGSLPFPPLWFGISPRSLASRSPPWTPTPMPLWVRCLDCTCKAPLQTSGTILSKKKVDFSGMSKDRYIEYAIEESIIEKDKFDLLTMGEAGRPQMLLLREQPASQIFG